MPINTLNAEVLVSDEPFLQVSRADMQRLVSGAATNARKRMRLCAHAQVTDPLHEMLIAMAREIYVRPHKHRNKSESVHVIEGSADLIIFDDAGGISQVVRLGDYTSGLRFYYRMSGPDYHMLLIRSEMLVVHEVTNGPFNRADTIFAPWAPDEADRAGQAAFIDKLQQSIARPAS